MQTHQPEPKAQTVTQVLITNHPFCNDQPLLYREIGCWYGSQHTLIYIHIWVSTLLQPCLQFLCRLHATSWLVAVASEANELAAHNLNSG